MKNQISSLIVVIMAVLASATVQAAPRSTPVTVVNDAASPVPVEAKSYRYVGNSTATTLPIIGFNGMHATCQTDFGPTARMCTTTEVIETPNMPSITVNTQAWVQPVVDGLAVHEGATRSWFGVAGRAIPDPSGSQNVSDGIICASWTTDTEQRTGTVIYTTASGAIGVGAVDCNNDIAVSCCLPQ